MSELIICEKPQAALKIATALAEGKPIKNNESGVPYYLITHKKKDIIVACAVGHLFGLEETTPSKGWKYPVFDISWAPAYSSKKKAAYTKKYLQLIKKLAKKADEFTVATDYDIEGEVIGLNVIRYACKKKDANRMKFSTLTKDDLIEAYCKKSPTLDWGQANAGETRHFLDWFNGINYSRALTGAIKSTGAFKIMSIGRVQGPSLKMVVDLEKEIRAFKPVQYWQISLKCQTNNKKFEAWHIKDKFWKKEEVTEIFNKVKTEKQGVIEKKTAKKYTQNPPTPFDLTTLQTEAYRCLKIAPKKTLEIGQELYTSGFISYPRTSSQEYPESIGYKKILSKLTDNDAYSLLAKRILTQPKILPNNGKKKDPAHPAIYPTGVIPSNLNSQEIRLYDLIVKRFLATFAPPAQRETTRFEVDVKEERFVTKGTRTITPGWHEFYRPYVDLKEEELPSVNDKDKIEIKKSNMYEKETKPPSRFTQASIIKELERRSLGTKSTRAAIIETLYDRGYVTGKTIEATELGIKTIDTLAKYSPQIIEEKLTAHFEEEMEEIRQGKKTEKGVLAEATSALEKILTDFKKKEKDIGKELHTANIETRDAMTTLGECPICKKGKIQIRKGKFGLFAACNQYPNCKTTFSLPKNALIKPTDKTCELCKYPMVETIKKKQKPMQFCLNPECKSKRLEGEAGKEAKAIAKGEIEKDCPACKKGTLKLRKSLYGTFLGCSNYPKCKHTEQLSPKDNSSISQELKKEK